MSYAEVEEVFTQTRFDIQPDFHKYYVPYCSIMQQKEVIVHQ